MAHDRLGIDFISVLGQPPVDFVKLAAGLGCAHISIALEPIVRHGYPPWSLREDAALRRETIAALRDTGVSISLGEGFLGLPGIAMANSERDLDIMCELGVPRVNVVSCDADLARAHDELAVFADLAEARGLTATLEFVPGLPIGDLPAALAAVRHVGRPGFTVLADLMHIFRSGSTIADLAAVDRSQIGYIQVCDVPLISRFADYADEARGERLPLGEGELPLAPALAALPRHVIVGIETPMLKKAQAGMGPRERLAGSVAVARQMLAMIEDVGS